MYSPSFPAHSQPGDGWVVETKKAVYDSLRASGNLLLSAMAMFGKSGSPKSCPNLPKHKPVQGSLMLIIHSFHLILKLTTTMPYWCAVSALPDNTHYQRKQKTSKQNNTRGAENQSDGRLRSHVVPVEGVKACT